MGGGHYLGRQQCCSSRSGTMPPGNARCPQGSGGVGVAGAVPRCRAAGRAPRAPRGSRGRALRDEGVTHLQPGPLSPSPRSTPGTLAHVGVGAEPFLAQLRRASSRIASPGQAGFGVQAGSVAVLQRNLGHEVPRSLLGLGQERRGQGQAGAAGSPLRPGAQREQPCGDTELLGGVGAPRVPHRGYRTTGTAHGAGGPVPVLGGTLTLAALAAAPQGPVLAHAARKRW